MLRLDRNGYISLLYNTSLDLYYCKKNVMNEQHANNSENDDMEENEDMNGQNIQADVEVNVYQALWNKINFKCQGQAKQHNKALYKDLKLLKASDLYIFESNIEYKQNYLTHREDYILYPRKEQLRNAIQKLMDYQKAESLMDINPNANELTGDIKRQVDKEMIWDYYKAHYQNKEEKLNIQSDSTILNVIHPSLQSFNKVYCSSSRIASIREYFKTQQQYKLKLDQWGKQFTSSPSEFLWLPARFVSISGRFELQGKLFETFEKCSDMPELKKEISELVNYFAGPLNEVHSYFKLLDYNLLETRINDEKEMIEFDSQIHAIVSITEMEIAPHSDYYGQWNVEGFSSDNILYTCLYIIEQDSNLTNGLIKFKRTPRADDTPRNPSSHPQCAHLNCPDVEHLCDPIQLIPLGSLDIKENLMIIYPNQAIHKVKGIRNNTDVSLKRKIVTLFVVNHKKQPFTINDVTFTKPLNFIKKNRYKDIQERSKNKQMDSQQFNY